MKYFKFLIFCSLLIIFNIFLLKSVAAAEVHTYSGTVTDSQGNPQSGISVQLIGSAAEDVATTGPNGSYELQVPDGSYLLSVGANSSPQHPSFSVIVHNLSVTGNTTQNFTLPVKTVIVTVTDPDGTPVPNAFVSAGASSWDAFPLVEGYTSQVGGSQGYDATTNANGIATLKVFTANSVAINVSPPENSSLSPKNTTITITGDMETSVQLAAVYEYNGTITDSQGNPLSGIRVQLIGFAGEDAATTGANGSYALHVPAGSYTLGISPISSAATAYPSFNINVFNLAVTSNTTQNFILPVRTVSITVVDPSGNPVPGAFVSSSAGSWNAFPLVEGYASQPSGSEGYGATTNTNGIATLKLFTANSVALSVTPPDDASLSSKNVTIAVTGDMGTMVQLSAIYTYSGIVADSQGNPLSGIGVQLIGSTSEDADTTGADGLYELKIPAGSYTLGIGGASNSTTQYPSFDINVFKLNVTENTTKNFTLPVKVLTIKVLDTNGQPMSGAGVGATAPTWEAFPLVEGYTSQIDGSQGYDGVTDANGIATLRLFAAETLSVGITPPNSYNLFSLIAKLFDFTEDRAVIISYADNPPTTATNLSPNAYGDGTYPNPATISLNATAMHDHTIVRTFYTLDGGPQKRYTESFTVSGIGNHTITYWSIDNTGLQEPPKTKTFTLVASKYNLSGAVYVDTNQNGFQDAGEDGYANAIITLDAGQSVETDENGNYIIVDLTSGSYIETLIVPGGYVSTTTNPATVALNAHTTQNFGIAPVPTNTPIPTNTPTSTPSNTPTPTPTVNPRQLNSLSPAKVWVSKAILDFGLKIDVSAEVYKDNTFVSSGQLNSVSVGSGTFGNADLLTIPFNSFSPVAFPTGSQLKIKVSARNACSGSLRNQGTARLWFNDAQANSRFDATIATSNSNYHLRNGFALTTAVGTGPRQNSTIQAGAKCSAFKSFGTWTVTL